MVSSINTICLIPYLEHKEEEIFREFAKSRALNNTTRSFHIENIEREINAIKFETRSSSITARMCQCRELIVSLEKGLKLN